MFCECGCGERTTIIKWSNASRGLVRGEHHRFVAGHGSRATTLEKRKRRSLGQTRGKTFAERFWARVDRRGPDECWPWLGNVNRQGYGTVHTGSRVDGNVKTKQAHRVAYELTNGPIPEGLEPDHLCRNRACQNPAHLEAVTHRENTRRGIGPTARNARKTHCKRGHPFDEANTYLLPNGNRSCRACQHRRYLQSRRAA
jgi:hypothetical protein